jgi:putative membrane protein
MKNYLLFLLLGFGAAAKAQAPDPDTTARHFIIMASIGNLQEIQSGKLAAKKASHTDISSFGQMMIIDHSNAEQKLLALAKSLKILLPVPSTVMPPFDLNLSKASGDDFDRMYIHAMLSGHRSTVMMFREYAINGKDLKVKAFAQEMLPTLKAHLEVVKSLDEKYKTLVAN